METSASLDCSFPMAAPVGDLASEIKVNIFAKVDCWNVAKTQEKSDLIQVKLTSL